MSGFRRAASDEASFARTARSGHTGHVSSRLRFWVPTWLPPLTTAAVGGTGLFRSPPSKHTQPLSVLLYLKKKKEVNREGGVEMRRMGSEPRPLLPLTAAVLAWHTVAFLVSGPANPTRFRPSPAPLLQKVCL